MRRWEVFSSLTTSYNGHSWIVFIMAVIPILKPLIHVLELLLGQLHGRRGLHFSIYDSCSNHFIVLHNSKRYTFEEAKLQEQWWNLVLKWTWTHIGKVGVLVTTQKFGFCNRNWAFVPKISRSLVLLHPLLLWIRIEWWCSKPNKFVCCRNMSPSFCARPRR